MSSFNSTHSYLKKRGILGPWKIKPLINRTFNQAIVIPAYSEFKFLPLTLESINKNKPELLNQTLVVVVVNNANNPPKSIKENNQLTLQKLNANNYQFTLAVVDAASSGLEMPLKHAGVGLARKIGMDLALPHLTSPQSIIFCTDADTQVSPDYLSKVKQIFKSQNTSAAVIGFSHLKSQDSAINDAIGQYEIFLKTTAEKMKRAGSPYGYVSMGSTIVCTAKAYCAVGGMPRKKATEDFYFLQELTKYCGVHNISETLVFPSPRPISRVYLGTGFRMEQMQNGFDIAKLFYSEGAFWYLSQWLQLGSHAWEVNLKDLFKNTNTIHPNLVEFLKLESIEDIWSKIQKNAPSKSHFAGQFHRWFDGLKTIRFLKRFTQS
ncbi:glycosyltransferase family 2 protein [Candidatus Marinimicrobia bacterium PRS2]|nr:glycosyltransferase family 2 protein [Candidatus Marinimicrobia bacterium PRS2]